MVLKSKEEIYKEKKELYDAITKEPAFADETGRVERLKERQVVLDLRYFPYRFIEESKRLMGKASTTMVYMVGKGCGKDIYEGYIKLDQDKDAALKLSTAGMWYFGWGLVDIDTEEKKSIIYDSFEADSFLANNQNSNTPVCHFLRGVIAGIWTAYSGKQCYGDEIACKAKGDRYCEVVIRPTE